MRIIRNHLLLFFVFALTSGLCIGQNKTSNCKKVKQVLDFIKENHIDPDSLDQEFIDRVNQAFLINLDPNGLYFTEQGANELKSNCFDLSNIDCKSDQSSMDDVFVMYKKALLTADSLIVSITSQTIDFNCNDSLIINESEEVVYPKDIHGLIDNWNQFLRFQTLKYYFSSYKSDDTALIKNETHFNEIQSELIVHVKQRERCKIKHYIEYPTGFDEHLFSLYLNCITSSFDPHSAYFSYNEKEQFESSVSTSKFSFGADLDENDDGEIFISRLIPGGPAWRSKSLKEGDVLLKLKFPGNEPIDLICSDLHEIDDYLYNSGSDKIEITARSQLGVVKTTTLKMEILESSENSVYSFVLDGEKRIGYILLPGFYTELYINNPLGCANDLVKEILKLLEDDVEGIILDLRNNGGGSLSEAIDLAGVFINSGTLGIYKSRNQKPMIFKDLNRGTIYDGPLVLLVNGFSASASEILASILQDYNRALIIGTKTFGKATGQVIYPLGRPGSNSYVKRNSTVDDYIKITDTKYYRLDGSSYQALGVTPDVSLPAHYIYSKANEAHYPSVLKNDFVEKDVTYEPFANLPVDEIQKASEKRISNNLNFEQFLSLNDSIKPLFAETIFIPLDFQLFEDHFTTTLQHFNEMDELAATPDAYYTISSNTFDEEMLRFDEYQLDIHSEFITRLQGDYYLEETYLIINELIQIFETQ